MTNTTNCTGSLVTRQYRGEASDDPRAVAVKLLQKCNGCDCWHVVLQPMRSSEEVSFWPEADTEAAAVGEALRELYDPEAQARRAELARIWALPHEQRIAALEAM